MKKKLLFTAYNLDLGGIEKSLVNLLNRINYDKYDVTLILEKKEGIFLDQIPSSVKVLEYKISDNKFVLFRKIYNRLKLIKWKNMLHNKYDFSGSFATYSIPGALLALSASKNSNLWVHGNYYYLFNKDLNEINSFFDALKTRNFNRVVFVAKRTLEDTCNCYNGIKDKAIVCNNYIDGEEIINKSLEKVDYKKNKITFVNVGRHSETDKKLTRIIEASKKLKEENYDFNILFIGDGPDSNKYKELVSQYNLDKEILFLGSKKNPFPYYKLSDAVLLSSECEGFPMVYLEAMILNKPILSTKVSDYKDLENKYGLFCDLDCNSFYETMKEFIDNGFTIKEPFSYTKYNECIDATIENMINIYK